jgi:hypothetical protein
MAPNSAMMNGTRWAIRPEMKATSRDRRHSFATSIEQLRAVVRPDAIAQVVKQFDDGEGLLWRPIGRDFEGNGERQTI